MRKDRAILILVFGVAAAIFTIKGLLAIFVQDFVAPGCVYFVIASICVLGLMWSVAQLITGKKQQ